MCVEKAKTKQILILVNHNRCNSTTKLFQLLNLKQDQHRYLVLFLLKEAIYNLYHYMYHIMMSIMYLFHWLHPLSRQKFHYSLMLLFYLFT